MFEALEDRSLLSSVGFSTASETVDASAGTFSIPVTLSGTGTQKVTTFASGFKAPIGVAFNGGNLFVANSGTPVGNGTVSEVTPAGAVSAFASGFNTPVGLAFDSSGNLYVANFDTNTVSKVTPAGAVSTFATGFDAPFSLTVDTAGNLFVANLDNNTVSEVTPAGAVSTFATGFDAPDGLAFDSAGNLYVANGDNDTVSKVTPAGAVSTFATGFDVPEGLAVDAAGNLYVANSGAGGPAGTTVSVVTPAGAVSTFAAGFDGPDGLAFDSSGNLYVANHGNNTMSEVSETVTVPFTLGGTAVAGTDFSGVTAGPLTFGIGQTTQDITGTLLSDPGPIQTLTFTLGTPTGGAALGSPSVNTLTITEPPAVQFSTGSETVDASAGTFSIPVTLAGSPAVSITVPFTLGGTAVAGTDFSGATSSPLTFAIGQTTQDITGKLLSDPGPNQTLTFTLGTPSGGIDLGSPSVNTLTITEPAAVQFSTSSEAVNASAGTFSIAVTLSGTPTVTTFATGFEQPDGLAFDAAGNLYVANDGNNTVSEVTPAGVVSTFATGFDIPVGLAFDAAGNLFVANLGNNTVSEVTPAGTVSTFATGFGGPDGLAFDAAGNLFVANGGADTVSEVTPAGAVSTFASGFDNPVGLAFDSSGNLYIANSGNGTVSEATPAGAVNTFASGFNATAGLAFNGGNLFVANSGFTGSNGTVSEVTPAGVVSTLASGFNEPVGVAFDAGNLYVGNDGDNSVSEVSETVTVPFTLGGTAAPGTAFSGITAGPLTFAIGQTTQDITGRLISDPGPNRTLTFTLGTPTGRAALVSPSVNTLTIAEPAATTTTPTGTGTSTTTSTSVPPVFIGEQRVFSKKGRHKKLVGFEFLFNGALNPGVAQSTGDYHVTQKHGKRVKVLPVESALYNPSNFSVTITVGGFKTGKAAQATIAGLVGANEAAIPQIATGL